MSLFHQSEALNMLRLKISVYCSENEHNITYVREEYGGICVNTNDSC